MDTENVNNDVTLEELQAENAELRAEIAHLLGRIENLEEQIRALGIRPQ